MATIDLQVEALLKFLSWAFNCRVVLQHSAEAAEMRKSNAAWGELDIQRNDRSLTTYDSFDEESGDEDYPRQEVTVSQVAFRTQLNIYSRSQLPSLAAWYVAVRGLNRVESETMRSKWLTPAKVSIGETGPVINRPRVLDNRDESMSLIELVAYFVLEERDEAARGTWIESVEITTELEPMEGSLNWDKERIPTP